jgi:hypothetical protein
MYISSSLLMSILAAISLTSAVVSINPCSSLPPSPNYAPAAPFSSIVSYLAIQPITYLSPRSHLLRVASPKQLPPNPRRLSHPTLPARGPARRHLPPCPQPRIPPSPPTLWLQATPPVKTALASPIPSVWRASPRPQPAQERLERSVEREGEQVVQAQDRMQDLIRPEAVFLLQLERRGESCCREEC